MLWNNRSKPWFGCHVSRVPLPIQHSVHAPRKAEEDGSSTWVPVPYVGNWDGVSGSCLVPGPDLAVRGNLGVNQQR